MATLDTIMNNTQIVPRSEEAEKLILGTLITESKWLNEIRELLPVDSFYFDMHKKVYRAILSLSDKGEKIDVMTVMAELPKIGEVVQPSEIASLAMNYAATGVIEYVHIINEKFKRRKFFELGAFLQSNAFSEVNDVNDVLADVKERMDSLFNTSSDNVYTLHDALDGVNRIISRNMSGETELTGDPTGFKNIDKRSGGLQGSDLVIIAAETSQGKALPMDANILLPDGSWIKNRDIKVGMKVASVDGEDSIVKGVYPQGVKKMYRIAFSDGRSVVSCEEHLWEIESSAFKSGKRILTTKDVYEYQNNTVAFKNRMRLPNYSGKFGEHKDYIIHPYVLGVLLGDGCLTKGATFCKPDDFVIEKVRKLIPQYCQLHQVGKDTRRALSHRIVTERGKANPVLRELERLNIRNKKSDAKFIPEEYLIACREQRLQLMQGLMDTDGFASNNNDAIFTSKSERLANDVRYLAHSLGFKASIFIKKAVLKGRNYGISYNVCINGLNKDTLFTLPRKKKRITESRRPFNCIFSVEYVGEMECQCISVSHPRELYIIDDFIVTHNTSLAIKMAMNCNAPVAFYSMEMKKEQIAARMMSIASGIPSNEILFSRLDEMKIQQIDRGVGKIYNKPVYFDDRSTSNIETILASIRMMKAKYGIRGAVIDYLQILNVNMRGESKERQMGEVARRLKNIAKELDIWIIALSQLNRDASNPVPTIARLRDSGQIAEAADMVILIYRPEVYGDNKRFPDGFSGYDTKGNALIDVAKGRNTGLTKFLVGFHAKTTDFFDLGNAPKLFTDESRADDLPF